jgi:hypothetical protein
MIIAVPTLISPPTNTGSSSSSEDIITSSEEASKPHNGEEKERVADTGLHRIIERNCPKHSSTTLSGLNELNSNTKLIIFEHR